jgi:SAM-dependent methyltransferase
VTAFARWVANRSEPDPAAPPCALCGASGTALRRLTPLGTSPDLKSLGDFRVVLCTECEVARTVPLPNYDALVIAPDVAAPALGTLQRSLLKRFIRQRVDRVAPLVGNRPAPKLLDIGGGACLFANAMARRGFDVTVFEPNAANSVAAGQGVRFIGSLFDESGVRHAGLADASFDLVTMWHSLEHVTDPGAALRLARRLLKPGGAIHVCVPNLDSLQANLTVDGWCYLDVPHHVSHFSLAGLERALVRAGFCDSRATAWNEEYEVFGFYQSILNRLTGSHNYFYNRAKKSRASSAGPNPAWTRFMTGVGPILIPAVFLLSLWAAAMERPSCAELSATVPA